MFLRALRSRKLLPAVVAMFRSGVAVGFGLTGLLMEQVDAAGHPVTFKPTLLLNPFRAVIVTVELPEAPCGRVSVDGFAFIKKSGVPLRSAYASTSVMRLQTPSPLPVTTTRIFVVATAANMNCRHTLLFPLTVPPGIGVHALPVQY